jgi:hypothetical protein
MKITKLILNIAGFHIRIDFYRKEESKEYESQFIENVRDYYKNFIIDSIPGQLDYIIKVIYRHQFSVTVNQQKKIVAINLYRQINSKTLETYYHVSGSQFQIIIRQITHILLAKNQGFILHASASKVNDKAVIFLGKSGAGKSTTMTLLSSTFTPLGDDSIIIKKEENQFYCYSSSAIEKNAWFLKDYQRNKLGAICFIKKSADCKTTKINNNQVILDKMSKQLFSEKEDLTVQMKSLLNFIKVHNQIYQLEVSLKKKDYLKEIISQI